MLKMNKMKIPLNVLEKFKGSENRAGFYFIKTFIISFAVLIEPNRLNMFNNKINGLNLPLCVYLYSSDLFLVHTPYINTGPSPR